MLKLFLSLFLVFNILIANDTISDDSFLEDDSSAIEEVDPFSESSDPFAEDDSTLEDDIDISTPVAIADKKIEIDIKEFFRSAGGNRYLLKEGINIGNSNDEDDKNIFVNEYQLKTEIKTSDTDKIVFRFRGYLSHAYNQLKEQYTDSGAIEIREGYKMMDFDSSSLLYGIFLPTNGKLVFNSTSDVLTQKNSNAYDTLSVDDIRNPVIGAKYQYYFDDSVFSAFIVPFKPTTSGTQYTIYKEDLDSNDDNKSSEDRTTLAPYSGLVYNASTKYFDYGVNVFYWFDNDNKITYSDNGSSSSSISSYNYKEEVSSVSFVSLDLNADIWGDINLKSELTYFKEKNIYHFFQNSTSTNEFETYEADLVSFGITFQKQFGNLNILPNYTFNYLKDVPENTNILYYENKASKVSEERNLKQHKYALAVLYSLNESTNISTIYTQVAPVEQRNLVVSVDYKLDRAHSLGFKGVYLDSEKQKSSDSKIVSKTSYLEYKYKF